MICHMMSFAWCYSHSHTCLECLCIRQNWWTGLASWHVNKPTRSMSIDCSLLRDALSQPGRVTEAVLSLELGRSGSPLHSVLFSTCLAQPVRRSFCDVLRFSYRMYRAVEASAVRCPRMGCCAKLCIWKIGKQQTADDGFWSLPAWSFMTLIGGESHFSRVLTLGLFVFCLANGGACASIRYLSSLWTTMARHRACNFRDVQSTSIAVLSSDWPSNDYFGPKRMGLFASLHRLICWSHNEPFERPLAHPNPLCIFLGASFRFI